MIKITHLTKTFKAVNKVAVNDVSFTVEEGEVVVLLGSSGCGKTTTLKMINRLLEPSSGRIEIDGNEIQQLDAVTLRRSIGYAFQGVGLFPHMNVADNISIVLKLNGVPKAAREKRARELLASVNLPGEVYADRFPSQLSGGQRQRVGVARALAAQPKYLLMDEPFGALDAINRRAMQEELLRIKQQFSVTIIFVTHDIFEALYLGDRIGVMNVGRLEQIGPPAELINHPATPFIRDLLQTPLAQISRFQAHQTDHNDRDVMEK